MDSKEGKRRIREFQRLLIRSEKLDNHDLLKINITELNKQFGDLVKDNLIASNQEKEYSAQIQKIQDKIAPKIAPPKKNNDKKMKNYLPQNDEKDIEKERLKHSEITNDILALSSQLKNKVAEVSVKVAIDEEVLNTVHDNMQTIVDGAQKTGNQMTTTVSERLGWRVYIQFGFIVLVYVIVTIVF